MKTIKRNYNSSAPEIAYGAHQTGGRSDPPKVEFGCN